MQPVYVTLPSFHAVSRLADASEHGSLVGVHLIVNKRAAFPNLDGLRRIVFNLSGADSVLLNRTGESFFLIGFKQNMGRRRPVSIEIPLPWLEDTAMFWQIELAAARFAALMADRPDAGPRPTLPSDSRPSDLSPNLRQVRR